MLKAEEKENAIAHSGLISPHTQQLQTMKELPSPPSDDIATRQAVMGSGPQEWSTSPPPTAESGHGEMEEIIPNPIIPVSPPPRSTRRAKSHSRLNSAPPLSRFASSPSATDITHDKNNTRFADFDWAAPAAPVASSKPKKEKKGKGKVAEDGGWATNTREEDGRPVQMSKTQRDKDRKKRGKARVVIEHVDIIKDEFWERRPWILSGKTG